MKSNTSRRQILKSMAGSSALLLANGFSANSFAAGSGVGDSPDKNASAKPWGYQYFIGIVGNPSKPEVDWSDDELLKIKALGVNMLQLNMAWGGRPANEVINLEDIDEGQLQKFKFRIQQAKKHGFKIMAHFGIPRMLNFTPVRPACIQDTAIQEKYTKLLQQFMQNLPEIEDIIVYTYDQQAWLCSEYGPCPRCSGIPLHDRLPEFINLLKSAMLSQNANARLWWKPWELTKGQTQMVVQRIDPKGFGLLLNPSTSNEVYPFNDRSFKSDLGVKRLVQMAMDKKIPVIGEFDHTLYKGLYLMEDYFPRLVYEQLQGWKQFPGLTGIKEYYGFAPSQFSVNASMLKCCFESPNATLGQLLEMVAKPYGKAAAPLMLQAWEKVAQGVEAYPWDTTYLLGPMGLAKENDGSHIWEPASIPASTWDTPIWKVNRKGNFMLTDEHKAHPWLFEDAGLRMEDAAALQFSAVELFEKAIQVGGPLTNDITMQRDFIFRTARALRGTSLHFLETLAAHSARMVMYDDTQYKRVENRLENYLAKDASNQKGAGPVAAKLEAFKKDSKEWLKANLNPRTYETNCTIDWDKFVPFQQ
jgi:hypothetical protein